MKILVVVLQLLLLGHCSQCWFFERFFPHNDISTRWFNYKKTFNKLYSNKYENNVRQSIFEENSDFVSELNGNYSKGLISFKSELNQFADLTTDEFRTQKTGLIVSYNASEAVRPPKLPRSKRDISIPQSKDWRKDGKVSPILDQGLCGSCYAFTTVSAIESFKAIKENYMPSYSVQELIDCTVAFGEGQNCNGCSGGSLACGFNYVKHNGLSDSNSVNRLTASRGGHSSFAGYKGHEGTCKKSSRTPLIRNFASYYQDATIEDIQAWLYLYGPIAVGINGGTKSFQFYKEGIYDDVFCFPQLNHAVLLVGYGTDEATGKDYWILKNSWNETWGEGGFMRIARGKNLCGIEMYGAFAIE